MVVTVVLAVVAAGGAVIAGPSGAAAVPADAVTAPVTRAPVRAPERLDGAALFKGLYFGLGPAATRYPKLVLFKAELTPDAAVELDNLLAGIEKLEPGFYDRYATAMYSGDHVEIQIANQDVARLFRSAFLAQYPEAAAVDPGDASGMCTVLNVAVVANFAIALAVAVVEIAAVAVEIILYSANWTWKETMPNVAGAGSKLTFEQWVDTVARTLPTR
jgi:SdpC family antimicrobial peptide